MDVRLSFEQRALRDAAAQVVDRLGPNAVGALDDDERVAKLDAAITASGWRELRGAETGDAPLASGVEVALVAEELGRGLADAAFLGPTLAAELRRLGGAPGATIPETVLLSPDLGEPARLAAGDRPAGHLAADARGAAVALVLLSDPSGHRLGRVDLRPGDVEVDLTRATAVPTDAAPVALEDPGRPLTDDDVERWTALGLAVTSADLVGVMRGAVALSCAYAAERRQYGAAIGSFQAVQHLLADAHVLAEGSQSAALYAAWAVDALPTREALAAGAVAKAYCSRAARTVCETAIQVHGGIGNTWECLAHVYLRRALLATDVLGGVEANLARVLAHHRIGGGHGLR